jgi:hypothetical protein
LFPSAVEFNNICHAGARHRLLEQGTRALSRRRVLAAGDVINSLGAGHPDLPL